MKWMKMDDFSSSNLFHLCRERAGFLSAGKVGRAWGRSSGSIGQEELCCSAGAEVEQTAAGTCTVCQIWQGSFEKGAVLHEIIA